MFAFNQTNERKEIEKELDVSFVEADNAPYSSHLGKYVAISTSGDTIYGCYIGFTRGGELLLLPNLSRRPANRNVAENGHIFQEYFVNSERPLNVEKNIVNIVEPYSEEGMVELAKRFTERDSMRGRLSESD
tara:strand:+ start:1394 stop:1789 length:396 start_codon:yes stop_codon:yes gene_type:complete